MATCTADCWGVEKSRWSLVSSHTSQPPIKNQSEPPREPSKARARFQQKEPDATDVRSAVKPLVALIIWRDTSASTRERNHTTVNSVGKHLVYLVIWRNTNASTRERNHTTVNSVGKHLVSPVIWRYTSASTQERNHTTVNSVGKHLVHLVISSVTHNFTEESPPKQPCEETKWFPDICYSNRIKHGSCCYMLKGHMNG